MSSRDRWWDALHRKEPFVFYFITCFPWTYFMRRLPNCPKSRLFSLLWITAHIFLFSFLFRVGGGGVCFLVLVKNYLGIHQKAFVGGTYCLCQALSGNIRHSHSLQLNHHSVWILLCLTNNKYKLIAPVMSCRFTLLYKGVMSISRTAERNG